MAPKSAKDSLPDISQLEISPRNSASKKPPAEPVADSWEDEFSDDDTATKPEKQPTKASASSDGGVVPAQSPSPPPPTPASPSATFPSHDTHLSSLHPSYASSSRTTPTSSGDASVRPDKSAAVARRLIAGALGVKVGRATEEEKEYEKVVRERERKRRDEARERERRRVEEAREEERKKEERMRSVWED
ncbi:hypothetical protein P152DRAFT_96353 [Eremomyces bilateralis CBS 781.70]|uniref:Uncharacterized protein n=1 Tax=Eremomyces bilateralis CBS 781.70 TaxID=1392243 RepID=A0A6G1FXD1_9PEZI|nr:uncharacterized protein P152DRAFT_96353 [Eremomyces bilateralis CBS 781.70]KAF1810372.1 hypothetical protein P152DRAFT_96353 [Eremomyces bilateralis CBS 781.70]